jgi:hypothetical protein
MSAGDTPLQSGGEPRALHDAFATFFAHMKQWIGKMASIKKRVQGAWISMVLGLSVGLAWVNSGKAVEGIGYYDEMRRDP